LDEDTHRDGSLIHSTSSLGADTTSLTSSGSLAPDDVLNELGAALMGESQVRPVTHSESCSQPQVLTDQERLIPRGNVHRLMVDQLPRNAKVSNGAKCLVQEFSTEIICFCVSEAASKSTGKAVVASDLVNALEALDLSFFVAPLDEAMSARTSRTGTSTGGPYASELQALQMTQPLTVPPVVPPVSWTNPYIAPQEQHSPVLAPCMASPVAPPMTQPLTVPPVVPHPFRGLIRT